MKQLLIYHADTQEFAISSARLFLAAISLIAIRADETEPFRFAHTAYVLLLAYFFYALAILLAGRWLPQRTRTLAGTFHVVDILWAGSISLVTEGPNSPFFIFFVFVVITAAYRWRLRRVLQTIVILLSILATEVLLSSPTIRNVFGASYELNRLIMRMAYLIVVGVLVGLLADSEKRLRTESSLVSELLALPRAKLGFTQSTELVAREIMQHYGSDRLAIILQNSVRDRGFIGQIEGRTGGHLEWIKQPKSSSGACLFSVPAECAWVVHLGGDRCAAQWRTANSSGQFHLPAQFVEEHPFETLMFADFAAEQAWSGRIVFFNPRPADFASSLRLLKAIVQRIVPAVHNVYLIEKTRAQAQAIERARMGRELHDGAMQTLVGAVLQLEIMRRCADLPAALEGDMRQTQALVRLSLMKLRALMQGLQTITIEARDLPDKIAEISRKFEQQTGIQVSVTSQVNNFSLAPAMCREVLQIIQEALINIHQHSGAKRARLELTIDMSQVHLTIEDTGKGFDIAGRYTLAELDALRRGPVVVKQRVRNLNGTLILDSQTGRGSRLLITIPDQAEPISA